MFYIDIYEPPVIYYPPVIEERIEMVPVYPAYPTVERRQIIIQPDGTRIQLESTTQRYYPYYGCCQP